MTGLLAARPVSLSCLSCCCTCFASVRSASGVGACPLAAMRTRSVHAGHDVRAGGRVRRKGWARRKGRGRARRKAKFALSL